MTGWFVSLRTKYPPRRHAPAPIAIAHGRAVAHLVKQVPNKDGIPGGRMSRSNDIRTCTQPWPLWTSGSRSGQQRGQGGGIHSIVERQGVDPAGLDRGQPRHRRTLLLLGQRRRGVERALDLRVQGEQVQDPGRRQLQPGRARGHAPRRNQRRELARRRAGIHTGRGKRAGHRSHADAGAARRRGSPAGPSPCDHPAGLARWRGGAALRVQRGAMENWTIPMRFPG